MLKCLRCGYQWMQRKVELPKRCPKCISPYWQSLPGRKYIFTKLQPGEVCLEPWYEDRRKNRLIMYALNQHAYRTKRKFKHYPLPTGMKIERVL